MGKSVLAPQNRREYSPDVIFGANGLAQAAIAKVGKENVISATIGAILDENEEHVFFSTVEKVFRSLPNSELSPYSPIAGLPDFLKCIEEQCFMQYRPEGHIRTMGISGGTGGIHHLVHLYSEIGDDILTADWYWGAYHSLCADRYRNLVTYKLLEDDLHFNHKGFQEAVKAMAAKQKNIVLIMNTPAHNPTGYTISGEDWDMILDFLKEVANNGEHNIIIGIDVAYIDYAENAVEGRSIFKKFENLPAEVLTVVNYSLSKSFTLYGMRVGGMVCISSDEDVANEFYHATEYASRSCWSNICRPAMKTMIEICRNPELMEAYVKERTFYTNLCIERAIIFTTEAKECGLPVLPYSGGFFLSIPTDKAIEICAELNKENIFLVPLKKGIRIAVCAVPKKKMKGLAAKVKAAMDRVG